MNSVSEKSDSKFVAFVRRNKMNIFGALCGAGDLLLAHRGGFNHDNNILWGGYEMTAGAASATFGGPKVLTASALTAGGVENLVSGIRDVHNSGLTLDSGLKVSFALAWTVAPLVLFCGQEIAEKMKEARPVARLIKKIGAARETLPSTRLMKKLTSSNHERIGSVLYNAATVTLGIEGLVALAKGWAERSSHKMEDAAIGLGISVLFFMGNAIAGMTPAPEVHLKRPRSPGLRILSLDS